jgi:hypothetical protein
MWKSLQVLVDAPKCKECYKGNKAAGVRPCYEFRWECVPLSPQCLPTDAEFQNWGVDYAIRIYKWVGISSCLWSKLEQLRDMLETGVRNLYTWLYSENCLTFKLEKVNYHSWAH